MLSYSALPFICGISLTSLSLSPLLSLPPPGIKEAFLKVAQGVISLYQKNQLTTNPNFEPSFSPVNSHSYPPHPLAHTKQSAYFYTTRSVEANGRVMVDSSDAIHNRDSGDGSSRCCW